ncbi:ubiquitin-conjugating enzyme/RWD-like protein [Absidia repens]|uniref:E2 ubiquitin-conjugating enzyme n=1 Tax=Absidia repens TaxID=90262 RepID=A0A1X2I7V6_9FUNG|nr:ubiquitin-conjugating enzyme/RWD-like protein [Absidia repens]
MASELGPNVLKRIAKEIVALQQGPLEDIQILSNYHDLTTIQAWIRGPDDTPYENGYFKIRLTLNQDFPAQPPTGHFLTKIFHPNVSASGDICVNTLKKDWKPTVGIAHILLTIKCLLIVPNPESALNEEAGKLLLEEYDDYAKRARLYTKIHATSGKSDYEKLCQQYPHKHNKEASSSPKLTTTSTTQRLGHHVHTTTTADATDHSLTEKQSQTPVVTPYTSTNVLTTSVVSNSVGITPAGSPNTNDSSNGNGVGEMKRSASTAALDRPDENDSLNNKKKKTALTAQTQAKDKRKKSLRRL